MNFMLTATNLDTPDTQPTVVKGIQNQHYIFKIDNPTSCDSYSFNIVAENDLGVGNSSEAVIVSLPTPPDLSSIAMEESLDHSLSKTAGEFMLTVYLNVISIL